MKALEVFRNGTGRKFIFGVAIGVALVSIALATSLTWAQSVRHDIEPGAAAIHRSMIEMGKSSGEMPMERKTDRAFATEMVMHHDAAIKMAKLELKFGANDQLKSIARSIIKSQSAEKIKLEAISSKIQP